MSGELEQLKNDLVEAISASETRMAAAMAASERRMAAAISASEMRMLEHFDQAIDERCERTETRLLTAFKQWAARFESKVSIHTLELSGLDVRFAMFEERLADVEKKLEKPG